MCFISGSMNSQQVAELLSRTLNPNGDIRKAAERDLRGFERIGGFGITMIEIVCAQNASPEIRIAAAVAVKNFVKVNWGAAPEVEVPDAEQEQLRIALLTAMFSNTGNLQKQLSHAVYLMAKVDFPQKWPNLISGLAEQLSPDNLEKLSAALSTMDSLFQKFRTESKSTELWTELKMCLVAVQAPLTLLYEQLVDFAFKATEFSAEQVSMLFELLAAVVSIFHSLCTQDLPEFFEDNLKTWVSGMLQLYVVNPTNVVSAAGEATPLDRLRTEMCEVVTMFAQRYEEEIMPHMESLISSIWQLLVNTTAETRYDTMVCSALDFLSAICVRPQYEPIFVADGVLKTLAEDVAVKNMTLRREDLELFEDEPLEYMRKDLEGTDAGTRRRGAVDLVRALCRRFEQSLMPILSAVVNTFLSDGDWAKKDVVYGLVRAMASKTETAKMGATSTSQLINIVDFYSGHVRTDLCAQDVNSVPVLKADALKFMVLFRNQLPPEALQEAVLAIENLLSSVHPIVHKFAAYALEKLMLVKTANNSLLFTSSNVNVAQLLFRLLSAFDADPKAQTSSYLIKALMRVIAIIDTTTARSAADIATKLAALVDKCITAPADASHTHFLFESICILIKKTSGQVEGGIDRPLFPTLEKILSQDVVDLIPYALQITGLLLIECASRGAPTDTYMALLPFLLRDELWATTSNIPAALVVLDAYLKVHPDRVMAEHGETLMRHYTRLISVKSLELHGFGLANAMAPHLDYVPPADGTPALTNLLNRMFARVQSSKTPKFIKGFVVFFFRLNMVRRSQDVANTLEQIQNGFFRMVITRVIEPELSKMADTTTQAEKRICVIGLSDLIEATLPVLGELFGPLADAGVKLCEGAVVHGNHQTEEEEQAAMYTEDGEFASGFCKLHNAVQPDVLRPEIGNWKRHFSEVVHRIGATNPAAMACLQGHVKQTLAVYLQA